MKKTLIGIAVVAAALSAQAEFAHKVAKVVVGYDANRSTLSNFPVLVRIPAATAAECRADGADIRFTSPDGETEYAHEIDAWNPAGVSTVWVLLPEMQNDTPFIMEWGDPDYTGPETPWAKGAVWDPAGYAGVWHMTEETGNVANATSKTGVDGASLDAVPSGALKANSTRHTATEAPIGYARFTGARQDSTDHYRSRAYLKVADYSNLGLGGNFMISGWYYMTEYKNGSEDWNSTTRNGRIFSRKTQWDASGGFDLGLNDSTDTKFFMRGSAKEPFAQFTDTPSAKQKWVHVAFVYDGASVTAYFNGGATKKSGTATAATDVALPLGIGSNVNTAENNDKYIAGSFDEVRLMKTLSGNSYDDWIAAEYAMGADAGFLEDQAISQSTPVISIAITSDTAREWRNESQTITLSRSSDSAWCAISINMEYSGSASLIAGLPATIAMAVGETSATLEIPVVDNDLAGGDLTLTATVIAGDGYELGASSAVALTVIDDETHAQVCSWTGGGDGTLWSDGDNWSSRTVPTEIDTVVFGNGVATDLEVTFASGETIEKPLSASFETPYAVTLGTANSPTFPALDFTVSEGAGTVTFGAEFVFSSATTISAAEDTEIVFTKVSGEADLTLEGAGTVDLGRNQNGNRLGGATVVRGGTVVVSKDNQLGNNLIIGGGDMPAVVCVNPQLWGEITPYANGSSTEILRNGFLDLTASVNIGTWQKNNGGTGPIFIRAGGSLSQGNRKFEFGSGSVTNLFLEGSFEGSTTTSINLKDYSWLVRPATATGPLTIPTDFNINTKVRFVVEDVPEVSVDLTLSGNIAYGWHPRDAFYKMGNGVLRLTGSNTYGGGGALDQGEGTTFVSGGTLLVDNETGSGTGNSLVTVEAGAVLGGTGRIGGLVDEISHWSGNKGNGENTRVLAQGNATAQAVVWPGTIDGEDGSHMVGALTVGVEELHHPVTFGDYSTLHIGVGEKAADALVVNGAVDISATGTRLELATVGELAKIRGGQFTILSATDGITGDFKVVDASKFSWHVTKVNARQVEQEGGMVEVYDAIVASIPQRGLSVIIR